MSLINTSRILALAIVMVVQVPLMAQKSEIKKARKALKESDLALAKQLIDGVTKSDAGKSGWESWVAKGEVYTQLLQDPDLSPEERLDAGKEALASFSKSSELKGGKTDKSIIKGYKALFGVARDQANAALVEGYNSLAMGAYQLATEVAVQVSIPAGDIHDAIANMYMQDALFQQAAKHYMSSVDQGYLVEQSMNNALAALSLAASPDYEKVLKEYRGKFPNNPDLKWNEANHRMASGTFDQAFELLNELIKDYPDNMDYQSGMGDYYYRLSRKARQELGELDYESAASREKEKERDGYLKKMIVYYEKAIAVNANDWDKLRALSDAYRMLGDQENRARINKLIDALDG